MLKELSAMNQSRQQQHNIWCVTVLCLLRVKPMHPYELQRLIREWHKDEFLDLRRGSLYHAIDRLREQGCIAAVETSRAGKRPERTVYRLTEVGEQKMHEWLTEMLARPVREPTQFFAALSFLPVLSPQSVQTQLNERALRLEEEIANLDMVLATMTPKIGRLVLVEVEYLRAMRKAERNWVVSLQEELHSGVLHWDPRALDQSSGPSSDQPRGGNDDDRGQSDCSEPTLS
jgi:DNA-binding PadR family transcriptional regulator